MFTVKIPRDLVKARADLHVRGVAGKNLVQPCWFSIFIKILLLPVIITVFSGHDGNAEVRFGTLSIIHPYELEIQLKPFLDFLEKALGDKVIFDMGRNYQETIENLASGKLDIGFIGPAPYVKIRDDVELLATIETNGEPFFRSVIVARRDSPITNLSDLKGVRFAFGSPESTLSFYVPAYILIKNNILPFIDEYNFLNRHDRVAKNVIIGKYDAGGIKESVFHEYEEYLKYVYKSKNYYDFVFVARKGFDQHSIDKLKSALIGLKDEKILNALKAGATGFVESGYAEYNEIDEIVSIVDGIFKLNHRN